jgi:hypothetical protein
MGNRNAIIRSQTLGKRANPFSDVFKIQMEAFLFENNHNVPTALQSANDQNICFCLKPLFKIAKSQFGRARLAFHYV